MANSRCLVVVACVVVLLSLSSCCCEGYDFYVAGRDGWVVNPTESYNHWAQRYRFQVNDTLVFKYKKGEDSVLQVTKEDYESCNTTNPIQKLDQGDCTFGLDHPGYFYFISGAPGRCANGQKLAIKVMSPRKALPPLSALAPSLPPSKSALAPSGGFVSVPVPAPTAGAETGSGMRCFGGARVYRALVGVLFCACFI